MSLPVDIDNGNTHQQKKLSDGDSTLPHGEVPANRVGDDSKGDESHNAGNNGQDESPHGHALRGVKALRRHNLEIRLNMHIQNQHIVERRPVVDNASGLVTVHARRK